MRIKIDSLNKQIDRKDLEKFTRKLYIHRQKDRPKDERGIPKVAIKKEHNLKDYKIELVGATIAYIYHCKENNMNDAIEKAIAHHKINKNDIINIYVTEGYWRKATAEDFKNGK